MVRKIALAFSLLLACAIGATAQSIFVVRSTADPAATRPLVIQTASLPAATASAFYSANLMASGGTGAQVWSIHSGALPAGLTLSPAGALSGAPVNAGSYTVDVQVVDSGVPPQMTSSGITIVVAASTSTLRIATALADGTVGVAYSATLAATGGTPPYSWNLSSGSLPGGLALSSSGVISGTPSAAGTAAFVVSVQDASNPPRSTLQSFSLTVSSAPPATLQISGTLSPGAVGTAYTGGVAASGGTPPYAWSVSSGSLPSGLVLNASTGVISGTPTTAGSYNFTVQVQDSAVPARQASQNFLLQINSAPSTLQINATLPGGTVNVPYSATLTGSGGTPPYTWTLTSGSLPPGLSLASATGVVSGTPTSSGSFIFVVTLADSAGQTVTSSQTMVISIAAAYTSRIDTSNAAESVPTLCTPAPCTMTSSDLNANLTYRRLTYANTIPALPGRQFTTNGSAEQMEWNSNSTAFYVGAGGGADIFFTLNPSTGAVAAITCTFSGTDCWNGFLSTLAASNNGDGPMSGVSPYVFYGQLGTQIKKQDFTATVSNPASGDTVTTVADVASCSGIPTTAIGYAYVTMNDNDTRFGMAIGGSSQDTQFLIYIFDTTSGCRWLNLSNFTTGGAWGTTGNATLKDEAGATLCTGSGCTGCSQIHNFRMDRDGRWARITTQCNAQAGFSSGDLFFWDIPTATVYRDHYTGGGVSPYYGGGHVKMGFDNILLGGDTNYSNLFFAKHVLPPLGTPTWLANRYNSQDSHISWNNQTKGHLEPAIVSFFGTAAPTSAWQDEVVGFSTDGSGAVYRFAHMYTRAHDFNSQGMANVSRDGKWAIFCSDWGGSRNDVFLVPLR